MAMRASSVPGAMVRRAADGNPFWSDKAKGEWQLRRNRPEDLEQVLPPVPGDDDTVQQELEEVHQDRGSAAPGQGSRWRRRSRSPVRLEKFSTPASWMNHGQEGLRSSGRMPPSGGSGATSTSQATARAREEGECSEGPWPPEDQEGIQRALEKEVVEHLHKENQRLKRCIEELKKKSEKGSWSEGFVVCVAVAVTQCPTCGPSSSKHLCTHQVDANPGGESAHGPCKGVRGAAI